MSSGGQILGAVVGGIIGFVATGFNPAGALQGAALGAGVGAALDPPKGPTVEGPRLQDKSIQTSTYGAAIPRVYGTIAGGGNIIQLENNELKETVRKKKSGGKGGGSSTNTRTYSYSATFQLSLCEGPIAGVRRIWCGDKLIYNAGSDDLETIIASNQAAAGFKIYFGTDDQLPDPRYEAEYGVGNVSAHRGEAYITFYDFQLADYSNTLQAAQFKVEVVSGGRSTQTLVDVALQAETLVTWESGAAFSHDFRGLSYCSRRSVLDADVSELDLGTTRETGTFAGSFNDDNVFIRGLVSYDEEMWLANQLNDFEKTTEFRRTSDLFYFYEPTNILVRGVRRRIGSPDFHYIILHTADGAGTSGVYSRAGIALAKVDGGIIDPVIAATTNYRINTAGDQLHEFQIAVNTISFRLYDESLNFLSAHSLTFPGDSMETVFGPFGSSGIGTQSCMLNGVLYVCEELPGGYRILAVNATSVVDDYVITATSGLSQLSAFFMLSDADGYIINGNRFIQFRRSPGGSGIALAAVVNAEVALTGLIQPAEIDTAELDEFVRGYRVSGGSIRGALEPLQAAFPFDVRPRGYQIQFLPRGQDSVVTIPWEDLGAVDGDMPGDLLQQSREMDSQLPARTTIKYLDAAREYAIAEQYSERLNTEAINRVDRELPLVLTADEAAGVAEVLNFLPWLERTPASFILPPIYRYLEPGDVVTLTAPNATYDLRLTETNETSDGRLECKAKPNRAALYTPAATGAEGVPPTGTIGLAGASLFVPLDIPVVDETLQDAVGFVGVMTGDTSGWPGALTVRSSDGGQTWVDLQAYTGKASIGTARGTLPASDSTLIDQRTLTVDMLSGAPESITRDQMLAGANYAAYGLDGRWEIVRFQNATLQTDGGYLLGGFVRGDKGTEWATGLHAIGDYFVLLDDPDNAFIGAPVESIALERLYRGVTSGASIDSATDVPFTYRGVNLECLSPVYAKGSRDGSSNFTGNFTRRSRLSSSWWTTGVVAPVGETSESYEIDVMNGSAVVRTISASAPTFSYSAANQTTDFGSAQPSITFRIFQLSATVGRGYAYEVIL